VVAAEAVLFFSGGREMGLKAMIARSEKETGCNWCRWMRLKHSGHIGYCAAYQRNTILKKHEPCSKFLRSLNADQDYQLRLMAGVFVSFKGMYLNYTGILPDSLISSDQLYHLFRLASYSGPVQLQLEAVK
jgi:hypothetical protein